MLILKAIVGVLVGLVAGVGRMTVAVAAGHKAELLAAVLLGYVMIAGSPGIRAASVVLCVLSGFAGVKLADGGAGGHA